MNCGKCPVNLICYTGMLTNMSLCPKCALLQIKVIDIVYYIECPLRQLTEEARQRWVHERDYLWQRYDAVRGTYANIIIIDKGPPQKKYANIRNTWVLPIALCKRCSTVVVSLGVV